MIPIDCEIIHSIIDGGKREKYLFLPPYGNAEYSLMTVCVPTIAVKRRKGDYASFSILQENKGKLS